jgi:hypothetical protein
MQGEVAAGARHIPFSTYPHRCREWMGIDLQEGNLKGVVCVDVVLWDACTTEEHEVNGLDARQHPKSEMRKHASLKECRVA